MNKNPESTEVGTAGKDSNAARITRELHRLAGEKDQMIAILRVEITDLREEIAVLQQSVRDRDATIAELQSQPK